MVSAIRFRHRRAARSLCRCNGECPAYGDLDEDARETMQACPSPNDVATPDARTSPTRRDARSISATAVRPTAKQRGRMSAGRRDAIRRAVLARDAYACQVCWARATQVDHIISAARGGPFTAENLRAICAPCNPTQGRALTGGKGGAASSRVLAARRPPSRVPRVRRRNEHGRAGRRKVIGATHGFARRPVPWGARPSVAMVVSARAAGGFRPLSSA